MLSTGNSAQLVDSDIFIMAGSTESPGVTTLNSYIAILDHNLDTLRMKELYFPGLYNETNGPNTLMKTGDNKYLLVANQIDNQINSRIWVYQAFFYFFDRDLDSIRFVKYVDTVRSRWPNTLIQDKQKNIIVAGTISSDSLAYDAWMQQWYNPRFYIWLAKYDSNANLVWEKGLLNPSVTSYAKLVLSHDSAAYILAAFDAVGNTNNVILKTDTAGNILLQNQLSWANPNTDIDICPTRDGNYAFVISEEDTLPGITYSFASIFYGKFNEQGDTLWTKNFIYQDSFACVGQQIAEAENGDLFILATAEYYCSPPLLLRTDSEGNVKQFRQYFYGGDSCIIGNQQLASMSLLSNGQILMSGLVASGYKDSIAFKDTTGFVSWFVLTDTFGCILPGCNGADTMWQTAIVNREQRTVNSLKVWPNPVKGDLYVSLLRQAQYDNEGEGTVRMSDAVGRLIYDRHMLKGVTSIDVSGFVSGVYFLEVIYGDGSREVRKIIKQ